MSRKPISLILLVVLVLSTAMVGCKPKAAPDIPAETLSPEDEGAAMIQEAGENTGVTEGTTAPQATEAPTEAPTVEVTVAPPVETATPTEAPAAATVEPVATAAPPATVVPVVAGTPTKHVVQAGENLFRISLRYGTTAAAIAQANGITNQALIYVGQVLTIPAGPGTQPPSPPPSGGEKTHVVQPGENLFRIALKYNYDQYYLARYNGISNPALIYPGQVIRIP